MKTVDRNTRASKKGKFIYCPECGAVARVFHFSWCAVTCCSCGEMVDKSKWLLENPKFPRPEGSLPFSLVFDRAYGSFVYKFNEKHLFDYGYYLLNVDSSGSREVWCLLPIGKTDYDDVEDLPQWIFDDFCDWIAQRHRMSPEDFSICRRMRDPGLGIMLPEDFEMLEKGQLPDGVIQLKSTLKP